MFVVWGRTKIIHTNLSNNKYTKKDFKNPPNIDPKLSSEAPSAFRAYAYTLEKPYDMDYGDKFVI